MGSVPQAAPGGPAGPQCTSTVRKGRADEIPSVLRASTAQGGDELLGSGVSGNQALS